MTELKPIFLFSDSQLLFWKDGNKPFLKRVTEYFDEAKKKKHIKASYIGASNGDNPAYFDIFQEAMKQIEVINCRIIPSKPDVADIDFLNLSDLILLAGGDIKRGWEILKRNNLDKTILDRYHQGTVLIGLSAGAAQLGLKGWEEDESPPTLIDTFKIIPYIIDVHQEGDDWKRLKMAVENGNEHCKGFGIQSGGGLIFHPDWSIEAIRHSLTEIVKESSGIKESLIFPPSDGEGLFQYEKIDAGNT